MSKITVGTPQPSAAGGFIQIVSMVALLGACKTKRGIQVAIQHLQAGTDIEIAKQYVELEEQKAEAEAKVVQRDRTGQAIDDAMQELQAKGVISPDQAAAYYTAKLNNPGVEGNIGIGGNARTDVLERMANANTDDTSAAIQAFEQVGGTE